MLRLRTKTPFDVQKNDRGEKIQVIIRIQIDEVCFRGDKVIAVGYYYYIDDNGLIIRLSRISSVLLKTDLENLEMYVLSPLGDGDSIYNFVIQRIDEVYEYVLTQEAYENYSTVVTDWEKDI